MEQNTLLTELGNKLTETRDYAVKALEDGGFSMLALSAKTKIEQVINLINQTIGGGATIKPAAPITFPPVTSFMGEELALPKPVVQEELSPAEERRRQFVSDIDALESTFNERENKDILEAFSLKEQQIVLRGLAKRYDMADFKTAKINDDFISRIREAIDAKEAKNKKITETELKIAGEEEDLS